MLEHEEENISYTVSEVLNKFRNTLDQEVAVLTNKDNNWVKKEALADKMAYYDIEFLLVGNHVNSAKELYLSLDGKNPSEAPVGHKFLNKLMDSFVLHNNRVDEFIKKENKVSTTLDSKNLETYKNALTFRNTVISNLNKMKKVIKGISSGELDMPEVPIKLHAKTPVVPLSLKYIVEQKYPEMNDYVAKKKDIQEKLNGKK